jgi:hypothetical protein
MSLAARFRALHSPTSPLCLLNAWDAGSARILVPGDCACGRIVLCVANPRPPLEPVL